MFSKTRPSKLSFIRNRSSRILVLAGLKKGTKDDMKLAHEDDQSSSTVPSWVKNRKQPHRSVLQGQSRGT